MSLLKDINNMAKLFEEAEVLEHKVHEGPAVVEGKNGCPTKHENEETDMSLTPDQEERAIAAMKDLIKDGDAVDVEDAAHAFLDNIAGFETDEKALEDQADRLIAMYKKKHGG